MRRALLLGLVARRLNLSRRLLKAAPNKATNTICDCGYVGHPALLQFRYLLRRVSSRGLAGVLELAAELFQVDAVLGGLFSSDIDNRDVTTEPLC